MTLLSDFHPKGEVSRAYGAYLERWGTPNRSLVLIDAEGVVRWVHAEETPLTIPGANLIFDALEALEAPEAVDAEPRRVTRAELTSAAVPPPGAGDHVRGSGPEAIVYLDLACPACAAAWGRIRRLGLRLCVRHFPLAAKRPRSPALHAAAEAAALQREDAFWAMVDSIYADQGRLDDPHLWERAERARPRPRAVRRRPALRGGRGARAARLRGRVRAGRGRRRRPRLSAGRAESPIGSLERLGGLVTSLAVREREFWKRWAANRAAERKNEYMSMFDVSRVSAEVGGKEISFETGKLARQAGGAVVVRAGDTMVLCTATMGNLRDVDFLPLTVDVEEKHYAAGKVPGSFFRREARAGEKATLTARMIDRPIRPLFPKGWHFETQLVAQPLSVDHVHPYDILAMNGASAALAISPVPVAKYVGAVRIGKLDGDFVVNPEEETLPELEMDLIVSGSDEAILMVECGANGVTEAEVLDALDIAHGEIKTLIGAMEELREKAGKEKVEVEVPELDEALVERIKRSYGAKLDEATQVHEKLARQDAINAVEEQALAELAAGAVEGEVDPEKAPEVTARVREAREGHHPPADRGRQEAARRPRPGRDPADRDRGRRRAARARLGAVHPR